MMNDIYKKKLIYVLAIFCLFALVMILLAAIIHSSAPYSFISIAFGLSLAYLIFCVISPYLDNKYKVSLKPGDSPIFISTQSFIAGYAFRTHQLMFDYDYLYDISKQGTITVSLQNLQEITKTSMRANNRRVWKVVYILDDGTKHTTCFLHNYTFWNKNFLSFLLLVQSKNPSVKMDKFNYKMM